MSKYAEKARTETVKKLGEKIIDLQHMIYTIFYRYYRPAALAALELTSPEDLRRNEVFIKGLKAIELKAENETIAKREVKQIYHYAEEIKHLIRKIEIIYYDALAFYDKVKSPSYPSLNRYDLEDISDLVGCEVKTKRKALKELKALIKACKVTFEKVGWK